MYELCLIDIITLYLDVWSRKMEIRKKLFRGFTLAEVLITLGIIGIVAAMTLPSLIADANDKRFRSQFLKTYSVVQQAVKKMEADDVAILPSKGMTKQDEIFVRSFKKYLSNTVDCGDIHKKVHGNGCFDFADSKKYYLALNGSSKIASTLFDDGQILMPDGALLLFENPVSLGGAGGSTPHLWIWIDVNGAKLPNRAGHDLFALQMTDNGLLPMGAPGTTYESEQYCDKKGSGTYNGLGCADKLIKNSDYFKWLKKAE